MATLLPEGKQSFTDGAGMPLVGGKLYTYDAGTSTPRPTYSDAAGTIPNTNPVVLDARGEATVFWQGAYKAVLKDASGVTVWTVDHVRDEGAALALDLLDTAPGKGAALVGFKQAGVGAVARTAQSKLREIVSVFDFMTPAQIADVTAGTLSMDVTSAIQAAIDYVTNGTVFFPAGAYKITATLKVNYTLATHQNCANLCGVGLGSTLLWYGPSNTSMIWYEGTSVFAGTYSKTTIENLFLKNNNASTGLTGIRLGNMASPLGYQAGVANVTIKNNKFDGFNIGVFTEYESDGIVIQDNVFSEYNQYGVYNTGSACIRIIHNYFQFGNAGSVAVYCEYSTITVSDNLIQSSDTGVTGAIQLKNASAFTITENYIEFAYAGPVWAILLQNSKTGYIGSNSFQGLRGADVIYIDGSSGNVNIGPNAYGYFEAGMNSLVRTITGANDVNVIGNQNFSGGPAPSAPLLGDGFGFVVDSGMVTASRGGALGGVVPVSKLTAAAGGTATAVQQFGSTALLTSGEIGVQTTSGTTSDVVFRAVNAGVLEEVGRIGSSGVAEFPGSLIIDPSRYVADALLTNGQMTFARIGDANIQIRYKGSDGVVRAITLTLS